MRDLQDYTEKYVNKAFEDIMVKIRKKTVMENCRKYPHANIIEVGCGMSPLFEDFEDFEQMIIVEPGDLFASNARQLAKERKMDGKVMVIHDFVENVDWNVIDRPADVDIVLVSGLLHEVDDPQKLLKQVKQLCSSETIVHINVPNAKSLHRMIAVSAGMIADEHDRSREQIVMQSSRTYDMELLHKEVIEAGFYVVDEGSYFLKPFTHQQMKECIDAGIIDADVMKGLEEVIRFFPNSGAEIYVNIKSEMVCE